MAENSPTFQHVGCAGLEVHKSRQGRLNPCEIGQSSLRDLSCCGHWFPTLKTLGYYRMSLRDKGLDRFLGYSLGSNPNEALDKNVRAPFARLHTVADRVRSGEVERSGGCKSLWSGGKLPEFRTKELDGKV